MDLLRFEELTYDLGNAGRRMVVSGTLPQNGVLVVRGPSGAGKSTLLRTLARLRPILHGNVWLGGKAMREVPPSLWRRQVHYVPQQPVAFDGTVLDNLLLPYRLRLYRDESPPDRGAVLEAMGELGLTRPDQDARTLSGGELARVSLLRAVLARPASCCSMSRRPPWMQATANGSSGFFIDGWFPNRAEAWSWSPISTRTPTPFPPCACWSFLRRMGGVEA